MIPPELISLTRSTVVEVRIKFAVSESTTVPIRVYECLTARLLITSNFAISTTLTSTTAVITNEVFANSVVFPVIITFCEIKNRLLWW